eukprot:366302-Chlamydomonas_euryale.AAC.4
MHSCHACHLHRHAATQEPARPSHMWSPSVEPRVWIPECGVPSVEPSVPSPECRGPCPPISSCAPAMQSSLCTPGWGPAGTAGAPPPLRPALARVLQSPSAASACPRCAQSSADGARRRRRRVQPRPRAQRRQHAAWPCHLRAAHVVPAGRRFGQRGWTGLPAPWTPAEPKAERGKGNVWETALASLCQQVVDLAREAGQVSQRPGRPQGQKNNGESRVQGAGPSASVCGCVKMQEAWIDAIRAPHKHMGA